jgi:predicted nucleotidyltransferase
MAVDYEAADKLITQYVSDVKSAMPIDKVYLYGSYARKSARWDSDVDLCFFSHDFEGKSILDVLGELSKLTRKYDNLIWFEANAFPTSELENDNPFVKEILRTGREIKID